MAENQAVESTGDDQQRKGPRLSTLVKAGAFVSVIVAIQVAAATVLLPSAEETRETGKNLATAAHVTAQAGGNAAVREEPPAPIEDTRETTLGSYHVVSFNPTTGTSLNIDFELYGIVLADDEEEFTQLYAIHEKRLKEQVTMAVRSLEASDLTDPGLGLIKRIILEKTNRALGKQLVREAVFSEFSFMER